MDGVKRFSPPLLGRVKDKIILITSTEKRVEAPCHFCCGLLFGPPKKCGSGKVVTSVYGDFFIAELIEVPWELIKKPTAGKRWMGWPGW